MKIPFLARFCIVILLAAAAVFSLAACGKTKNTETPAADDANAALTASDDANKADKADDANKTAKIPDGERSSESTPPTEIPETPFVPPVIEVSPEKELFEGQKTAAILSALASSHYYLAASSYIDGVIYENTLAVDGDRLESRSVIRGVSSHAIRLGDETYYVDDENRVYFKTTGGASLLTGSIRYPSADYLSSGTADLPYAKDCFYDEYSVLLADGSSALLRLYLDDAEKLQAIVLLSEDGTETIEQDVALFSTALPSDAFTLPDDYTLITEDDYFALYY